MTDAGTPIAELRAAFGAFMTGVTVVTALTDDRVPVGITVNSFTSVSLEPPLLLVCPAKSLSSFEIFNACDHFAVNILAEHQQSVANVFAGSKDDRFAQVAWSADVNGCPLIDEAAARFSCGVHERIDAGDHIVLIGRIDEFDRSGSAGLGYSKGGYFSLGMERRAQEAYAAQRPVVTGVIVEHEGQVLLQQHDDGLVLPQVSTEGMNSSIEALHALLDKHGVTVKYGTIYSIYESLNRDCVFTYYRAKSTDGRTGGLGKFVALDTLHELRFEDSAVRSMLMRYAEEYRQDAFGQYVGDEDRGIIQRLTRQDS